MTSSFLQRHGALEDTLSYIYLLQTTHLMCLLQPPTFPPKLSPSRFHLQSARFSLQSTIPPLFGWLNCLLRCLEDTVDKCSTCTQKVDHKDCERTCDYKKDLMMNDVAEEWLVEGSRDPFDEDCEDWELLIDQSPKGAFVKYDKASLSIATSSSRTDTSRRSYESTSD